jgi:hypothetical protein
MRQTSLVGRRHTRPSYLAIRSSPRPVSRDIAAPTGIGMGSV